MAANQSAALKNWSRIIQKWPVDRVRPQHVSFQTVMQSRIDKATSPASNSATPNVKANEALVSPIEPPVFDEQKSLKQIKALDALLENKYANAFPMPEAVRHPKSSPQHYDTLIKELDEAPTRSWIDSLVMRVKGSLRFT